VKQGASHKHALPTGEPTSTALNSVKQLLLEVCQVTNFVRSIFTCCRLLLKTSWSSTSPKEYWNMWKRFHWKSCKYWRNLFMETARADGLARLEESIAKQGALYSFSNFQHPSLDLELHYMIYITKLSSTSSQKVILDQIQPQRPTPKHSSTKPLPDTTNFFTRMD